MGVRGWGLGRRKGSGIRDQGSGVGDQGSGVRGQGLGVGEEGRALLHGNHHLAGTCSEPDDWETPTSILPLQGEEVGGSRSEQHPAATAGRGAPFPFPFSLVPSSPTPNP
ncbi:MAG: hypothetical protein DWQ30_16990 [Acidobacteria bacterium]|nr:MAG: hypothetical protein DWQ30_16990 [Acidobacteriota bacterium]